MYISDKCICIPYIFFYLCSRDSFERKQGFVFGATFWVIPPICSSAKQTTIKWSAASDNLSLGKGALHRGEGSQNPLSPVFKMYMWLYLLSLKFSFLGWNTAFGFSPVSGFAEPFWWHSLTKARWSKFPQHDNAVYASITCTYSLVVSKPLHFQEVNVCKRWLNEVGASRPSENLFCWKSEGLRAISSPAQSPSHWMRHFQRSPPNPKISIFPR